MLPFQTDSASRLHNPAPHLSFHYITEWIPLLLHTALLLEVPLPLRSNTDRLPTDVAGSDNE